MIPAVQITIPPATAALLAYAKNWPANLTRNLVRTLDLENELTTGHIKKARATGKGPFPVAEGRLGVISQFYRRAVRPSKAVMSGTAIESAIGNNMIYAGAHEFGLNKTVNVKAHRSANAWVDLFEVSGRVLPRWQVIGEKGRKKKIASGTVMVRAHAMQMNIPARAPIQRGIADRLPLYGPALGGAIVNAFSGGTS